MTLWVFGYGSLLWNPGFEPAEQEIATLQGYERSFCMRSIHHRGSVEDPGLVLALDKAEDGLCDGVAFRVEDGAEYDTLAYLRERELISSAYLEKFLPIELQGGYSAEAVVYVIDPHHVQYCNLDKEEQARIIADAVGGRGPNTEYLYNTADHLSELGIADADLNWLADRVRSLTESTFSRHIGT